MKSSNSFSFAVLFDISGNVEDKVGFGKTFAEVKAMSDAETPENKSVN